MVSLEDWLGYFLTSCYCIYNLLYFGTLVSMSVYYAFCCPAAFPSVRVILPHTVDTSKILPSP